MKLSVIIPTINNLVYLENLVLSLERLKHYNKVKILIIKQGLKQEVPLFLKKKNIDIIFKNKKKLSYAKNIGIKLSEPIQIFIDDDIIIKDIFFFDKILKFAKKKIYHVLFYKINILNSKKPFSLHMLGERREINRINYKCCIASAMVILKNNKITFDENFGIGAKYGSAEESEFVLNSLKNNKRIFFDPSIMIEHPEIIESANKYELKEKYFKYGMGQGALLRKYLDTSIGSIFDIFFSFGISMLKVFFYLLFFKRNNLIKNYYLLYGKIISFRNYKK